MNEVDYVGQRFEGEVVLDGNTYRDCTFENVQLVYGGGELTMDSCNMDRFSWRFTGNLANGLYALYQLFGQEGLLTLIRGFTEPTAGEVEMPPREGGEVGRLN
jgi:hypothetical protein